MQIKFWEIYGKTNGQSETSLEGIVTGLNVFVVTNNGLT